ncbi:MAG: hypothetical protein ACOCUI_01605 [bacterium]
MEKFLGNKKIIIRFISLYSLGLLLFFISWITSYLLLPDGMLNGFGALAKLAGDSAAETLGLEFIKIFGLNIIGLLFIIIGNYILRVNSFSFGYLIPLTWMILYGITLGTNSFSIPLEEPMAPTLAILGRSGLYEMMAATLLAVSTNSISVNKSESFSSKSKPIPKNERNSLKKEQWTAIGIAVLILAVAALREAYMIVKL